MMVYTAPKMGFQKTQKWECWLDQIIVLPFKETSTGREESHKPQQKEMPSIA